MNELNMRRLLQNECDCVETLGQREANTLINSIIETLKVKGEIEILKPCKFCKSKETRTFGEAMMFGISCKNCDFTISKVMCLNDNKNLLEDQWNLLMSLH